MKSLVLLHVVLTMQLRITTIIMYYYYIINTDSLLQCRMIICVQFRV